MALIALMAIEATISAFWAYNEGEQHGKAEERAVDCGDR
jgi:hypothetical protein